MPISTNAPFNQLGHSMVLRDIEQLYMLVEQLTADLGDLGRNATDQTATATNVVAVGQYGKGAFVPPGGYVTAWDPAATVETGLMVGAGNNTTGQVLIPVNGIYSISVSPTFQLAASVASDLSFSMGTNIGLFPGVSFYFENLTNVNHTSSATNVGVLSAGTVLKIGAAASGGALVLASASFNLSVTLLRTI